jgi:tellurite resistance protein
VLCELTGHDELSAALEARVESFARETLDVRAVCEELALATIEERRKLLEVVVAVHESDEVWDYDEDAFVRELASALGIPDSELAGLAAEDVSLHELGEALDVQDVGALAELVE